MFDIKNYVKSQLNKQQFDAACRTQTNSLILAGAGSGKTRTLTYKIAYLIFGLHINPYNILAVTFTNKAAGEMKERIIQISQEIQSNIGENYINSNKIDFDEMIENHNSDSYKSFKNSDLKWIGTFHSIFLRILKEEIENLDIGYNKNFGVYDETESQSLIKQVISEMKMSDKVNFSELKRKISNLKSNGITYKKYNNLNSPDFDEITGKVYEKYQKSLIASNSLDFDDLLLLPNILFDLKQEILEKRQNKFKYILVDEAQDTNHIQFDLIKKLCFDKNKQSCSNITFIGDDFQSIYGWRGAVMDNFLNVSKWWSDIQTFKLEVNYRSKSHIVEAGNQIILKNSKQYSKNITSNRSSDDKIRLFSFSDETDEAFNIIQLINKFKQEKNMSWGDFAILYRTNAQSQPFEQVLVTQGIPYKIWGGFKFFERKEIKDIISYLKFFVNPRDGICLKRIINTPNRKIGDTTVEKLNEYGLVNNITLNEVVENIDKLPIKLGSSTIENIKHFNTIIKFIKAGIDKISLSGLISQIVSSIKYKDYLVTLEGKEKAEERIENIGQLINMASKYDNLKDNLDDKNGLANIQYFLDEISLMTDIEENIEGGLDAVKLMSIHSSKGLEFTIVFIVGLEDNIFPLSKAKFSTDEMEEERRLMYVAITRAKDILFLSYANSRQQWGQIKYNSPSRFLDEIPNDLIKNYDLSGSFIRKNNQEIDEGDYVIHKLFGDGTVIEVWNGTAVVKFANNKYGTRKIDVRFLDKQKK